MLSMKKAPAQAVSGETNAGAPEGMCKHTIISPPVREVSARVNSYQKATCQGPIVAYGGLFALTHGEGWGTVPREAENLQQKARRSLDTGIFYCAHAPEKHGVFTAIYGRVWANTIPFGEICPPFCCGFRHPAFFASCVRPKNEKTTEVPHD